MRRWRYSIETLAAPFIRLWDEVFATSNSAALYDVNWFTIWVPGLPQWLAEKRRLARCLFVIYTISFVVGLLLWGTSPGAVCWGIAFSCHIATIIDVIYSLETSSSARITGTLTGISLLTVGALVLHSMTTRWLLNARVMTFAQSPLEQGDTLLLQPYWSTANPRRGDVVLWTMPTFHINEPQFHRIIQFGGEQIDRVLAVAGDVVEFQPNQLLINDQPAEHLPLNPLAIQRFNATKFTVPTDCSVVIPSTNPTLPQNLSAQSTNLAIVSNEFIRSRVMFRNFPLTRMGRIR